MIEIKGNIFIQVLYSVDQHDSIVQRDKGSCKLVGFENSLAVYKFFMCEQINRFIKTLCAGIVSTGALGKSCVQIRKGILNKIAGIGQGFFGGSLFTLWINICAAVNVI